MLVRKLVAITALAAGLGGSVAAASNLTTIVGSTSTAGAPTVCFRKAVCTGKGKQQPALQIDVPAPGTSSVGG